MLIVLTGFSIWVNSSTLLLSERVRQSTILSDQYAKARFAVVSEQSLVRKYRLEPSPQVRTEHQAAANDLQAALTAARAVETGQNRAKMDDLLASHVGYLAAVDRFFNAVDQNTTGAADLIYSHDVDPTSLSLERQIDAEAQDHHDAAARSVTDLGNHENTALLLTLFVFAVGLLLLYTFRLVLATYQARVDEATTQRTQAEIEKVKSAAAAEQAAARRGEERMRRLVRNLADILVVVDRDCYVEYTSPSFEKTLGARTGYISRRLIDLFYPEDRTRLRLFIEDVFKKEGTDLTGEFRVENIEGGISHLEVVGTYLGEDDVISGVLLTCRDITERKRLEEQLAHQAFHDPLTGLPNRALFMDRVAHSLVRAGRTAQMVAVLFIDIDDFALINDSLGHKDGDRLLMAVAQRLQFCVRAGDTVARLGGDEFTVLLEGLLDVNEAIEIAERLTEQMRVPFPINKRQVFASSSIGIVVSSSSQDSPLELLRNADIAMFEAKDRGKSRLVVFNSSMNIRMSERMEMENDLRNAVEQQEFVNYYQPIVDLQSGKISEVEALVRWQHPRRGLVTPMEFISVAEDTGMILPIGELVLENACLEVKRWHGLFPSEPPLTLSVNLSARQFDQPDLVPRIGRVLERTGFSPKHLKLEITESIALQSVNSALASLQELREMGIRLALDDFGTGYSALNYLKHYPVDTLKIDRSFVDGVGNNDEDTAIVYAVIAFARTLRLNVTAEGIETAEQLRKLRDLGCHRGQGYYFSRPLPADGITALLANERLFITGKLVTAVNPVNPANPAIPTAPGA